MRRTRAPRAEFDPALDGDVRWLLQTGPLALRAARAHRARGGAPAPHPGEGRPNGLRRTAQARGKRKADPFPLFALIGFLILVAGLTDFRGLLVALAVAGMVAAIRWAAGESGGRSERRRVALAVEHGDRYVLPEDLDRDCADLLRRAQEAADSVLASEINRAGLIDTIDNAVTLPEETWQIARRLARISAVAAEHRRIVPRDLPYEVSQAFTPYDDALAAALSALTTRVRALEDYALQVYRADQVYRAFQQLEVLTERTPDYQDLLAETVPGADAAPRVERLADQAAQVRETFRRSVAEVRRTGAGLIGGGLSEDPGDLRR
ncbi:hypothetical protein [Spongiactinospora sp. 9N601]|uniref:hypothetical protein n=1 Tax=Spongiactinospora sp. 9N601 TaxID=3375149 RepID=UPI003787F1B2